MSEVPVSEDDDVNSTGETLTCDRHSSVPIKELKQAFEHMEVFSPGISGQLVQCIVKRLQRW